VPDLNTVCVFCASSRGTDPAIAEATVALGRLLADEGIELVFGGGAVGLMGLLADTVLDAGGRVTGIIPTALFPRQVAHQGCTELISVETMHERKAMMYERSDGFVALPGGFGTLEELAETLTWAQIGLHSKPVGVLDVGGFWQPLIRQFDRAVDLGVLRVSNRQLLIDRDDPAELLEALRSQVSTYEPKWIDEVI
jgi:uncharacterized protein (TIGR00730 family)